MPRKKQEDQPPKSNIGILLPVELWKRFRIRCIELGRQPGHVLEDVLREYLKAQGAKTDATTNKEGDRRPKSRPGRKRETA